MSTVFPHRRISGIIFSAPFIQRSQYITLRLLFEGGNYMRKYSMYMLGIRIPLNGKKAYLNGFPLTKTPGPSDWPCSGLYDTTLPWMDKLRDRGASSSLDIEACRNIGIMGNRASPAFWALCSCSLSWPTMEQSCSICCRFKWGKPKTQTLSKLWQKIGYGKTSFHNNHRNSIYFKHYDWGLSLRTRNFFKS